MRSTAALRAGGSGRSGRPRTRKPVDLLKQQHQRLEVAARGGNAALMYRLTQVKLIDNTYKNHVYALIQLQADAVKLSEPV